MLVTSRRPLLSVCHNPDIWRANPPRSRLTPRERVMTHAGNCAEEGGAFVELSTFRLIFNTPCVVHVADLLVCPSLGPRRGH